MRHIAASLVVLCLAGVSAHSNEQISIGETIEIDSRILGEVRTVLVSPPAGYDPSKRYPVLYMTDGDQHLTHTRGTADFLARNGLVPPLIIVGVINTDRSRDLTPTRAGLAGLDGTLRELPTSGGGSDFLDFFEKELFPFVDSHYSTLGLRLLAGHSLGGLFALESLFTRPAMFAGILAVSPTLMWDGDLPLRQARGFLEEYEELNASLFVAMGNEERGDPRPTRLDRLEETLKGGQVDGFEWRILRIPEETHSSVVLRGYYWGLRHAFEPWLLPADPATGAYTGTLDDLVSHYARLSERYDIDLSPPEQAVNAIGYRALFRNDIERAIAIFRYNVELYPDAANVHDSLGEALERAGRLGEAFSSYSRAVDRASRARDPNLGIFKANRDRAKKGL